MPKVDADAVMGGVLRRMRVEAGYTVHSAATALRLPARHLDAVEDGDDPIYFADLVELMELYRSTAAAFVLRVGAEIERLSREGEA